jgi:hypothetical protein
MLLHSKRKYKSKQLTLSFILPLSLNRLLDLNPPPSPVSRYVSIFIWLSFFLDPILEECSTLQRDLLPAGGKNAKIPL